MSKQVCSSLTQKSIYFWVTAQILLDAIALPCDTLTINKTNGGQYPGDNMKAIADVSKGVRYGYNGEKVVVYEHPKNVNGRFSYGRTETGEVWNPDFRVATTKPVVKRKHQS